MENFKEAEIPTKREQKNKVPPKLLAIAAPLVLLGLAAACKGGEGEEQQFPGPTPTIPPSPTATMEAMPSQTLTVIPATPTQEITATPEATPTTEISIYQSLKEKIESQAPLEQQTDLMQKISDFERADKALEGLMTTYNSRLEPDGTPTLLALTTKRLGNLDLTFLYPGLSPEEARKKYAEEKLMFPADYQELETIESKLAALKDAPVDEVAQTLTQNHEQFFNFWRRWLTEVDTKEKGSYTITMLEADSPQVQQAKATIENLMSKLPIPDDFEIQVGSGGGSNYGQGIIYVDRQTSSLELSTLHEYSHGIDIDSEYFSMSRFLTPEQIIDLAIARERILSDPILGRDYPSVERLLTRNYGQALAKIYQPALGTVTLEEIGIAGSEQANDFWTTFKGTEPFQDLFSDLELDQKTQQLDPTLPPDQILRYDSLQSFLEGEKAFFDNLAQRNPYWKKVVDEISAKPQEYQKYFYQYPEEAWLFYSIFKRIGPVLASEWFAKDNKDFTNFFSSEEKAAILGLLYDRFRICDFEKFQGDLSYYLYLKFAGRLESESPLIEEYLKLL